MTEQVIVALSTCPDEATAKRLAAELGVAPGDIFDTLSVYLGSAFVNDFNLLGRTYRVTAQAEADYRDDVGDIGNLYARSDNGSMVPLGSVSTFTDTTGARVATITKPSTADVWGCDGNLGAPNDLVVGRAFVVVWPFDRYSGL